MLSKYCINETTGMVTRRECAKTTLIYKYCRVHRNVTWHVLGIAGELICLNCFMDDKILSRIFIPQSN
jgi:hypothetical protein